MDWYDEVMTELGVEASTSDFHIEFADTTLEALFAEPQPIEQFSSTGCGSRGCGSSGCGTGTSGCGSVACGTGSCSSGCSSGCGGSVGSCTGSMGMGC